MTRWLCSLLVLCLMGGAAEAAGKTPGELQIGDSLRDATLQGLNGAPRKLSEFRGKPLIINMWASWCGPCRAEMASLERLAWLDPAGQFTVIGISTDDYPEQAMSLLRKSNATISQFIDSKLLMENMLGAKRLPLTVLIDANGRVLEKIYGAQEWDDPESLRLIGKMFRIRVGTAPPRG
jgi:thiol-disulfide isomerase/thioredoxin